MGKVGIYRENMDLYLRLRYGGHLAFLLRAQSSIFSRFVPRRKSCIPVLY